MIQIHIYLRGESGHFLSTNWYKLVKDITLELFIAE